MNTHRRTLCTYLSLALLAVACAGPTLTPTGSPTLQPTPPSATATAPASPTALPTGTATPTTSATATATPFPTPIPTATETATATSIPTRDPYAGLTITDLAARAYGGGQLRVEQVLAANQAFTRTLITYPSDGLTIYGFMNTPRGEGPFPVVLVLHGYVNPDVYTTLTYTTRYADALARAGYLVIHPNFRNYPPSDDGPNPFRIGYAIDALNLIALVQAQAGQPGPLRQADTDALGLWGHSMGGGISLRVITVSSKVQAAVLYGSMSGDEQKNHEKILEWSGEERGQEELDTPQEDLLRISPIYHLARIQAAVSVHHGALDGTVPLEWSQDLCQRLEALEKTVECFTYTGQPHTFGGEGDQLFIRRVVTFFDRWLKEP